MYLVTKHFITGLLAGMTITEKTGIKFTPKQVYGGVITGGMYVVTKVRHA